MSNERELPQGRLSRLARLAAMGVKTGAGLLLDRDQDAGAHAAAEVLGNLRGLAAKVGQMAGYVDGVVPEQHRASYEKAMTRLRSQTPRSSPAEARRLVEEELKAPIDQLFSAWEDEPIASASIGQVHKARLLDGREVAVKVQHAGIVQALESDLANAGLVENMLGVFGARRFDSKALLATLRERFREELDYALEGRRLAHFAQVHAGDPTIGIPELIRDRSSKRVLTTEFVRGRSFEEACEASEEARRAWAQTLWRYVFKGNTVGCAFNADPHPGNYMFNDEGRIWFLDFGCVQEIPQKRMGPTRAMHRAALMRDEAAFNALVREIVDARPGRLERMAQSYLRRTFEPVFSSPYRITRAYSGGLMEEMKSMALEARKTPDREFFTMPPDTLFMNRMHFGFFSVLARLDVEVDYAAVERGYWHEVPNGGSLERVA